MAQIGSPHRTQPKAIVVNRGFTLAELLIALAILGVIATFTIPKVLQSLGNAKNYALAKELEATLIRATAGYVAENHGCFKGDVTCRFNRGDGTPLDGKPATSTVDAHDKLADYLDNHLNYLRKVVDAGEPETGIYYYLANGASVNWAGPEINGVAPGVFDVCVYYTIYLNRTPEDIIAQGYPNPGVDTGVGTVLACQSGVGLGGYNNWMMRMGAGYSPAMADTFDQKEHPGDTCQAVGGANCNLINH